MSRRIDWYPVIDSTMHAASRLAAEGAPSGTVVGSDEQSAGYGRYGRPWHSGPAEGLYFSVILRCPFPLVTLALGLATVDGIPKATGTVCDLRWPNDVLIGDKKCAGILTQLEGDAAIAGIGINLNRTRFPPELAGIATSIHGDRQRLLDEILLSIDSHCEILVQRKAAILDMFSRSSSYVSGRRVIVDDVTGTTAGLTSDGYLLLRDDSGKVHTIVSGGVRPCP